MVFVHGDVTSGAVDFDEETWTNRADSRTACFGQEHQACPWRSPRGSPAGCRWSAARRDRQGGRQHRRRPELRQQVAIAQVAADDSTLHAPRARARFCFACPSRSRPARGRGSSTAASNQMRADEAGPAGDENLFSASSIGSSDGVVRSSEQTSRGCSLGHVLDLLFGHFGEHRQRQAPPHDILGHGEVARLVPRWA